MACRSVVRHGLTGLPGRGHCDPQPRPAHGLRENVQPVRVRGWGPSGTGQAVGVECYEVDGDPADTRFTIQFMR